ncbi:MAG TPA: O-antigen ligase family protein [Draconibacterium sp.]|nr:O-antigen ligase family protein [Draconibacterium sp.]
MTGSFFNPGPYAGYLVSIIPLAITLFLIKYTTHFKIKYKDLSGAEIPAPNESHNLNEPGQRVKLSPKLIFLKVKKITYKNWPYLIQYLIGIAIITILLVLPASKSRAAWLATIGAVFFIFIQIWQDELMVNTILFRGKWKFKSGKILSSTLAKILGILIIIVLLAGGLFATYKMKQGSANGRLLIWKVSSEIIKDKPLLGHGINAFEAKYMDYQAKYFQANPESEESFLADNTKYAFNELIRIATETGLIGLILSILLLWFLLFGKPVDISKQEKIELIALRTTLMALIIFGLFSYPDEIIPIKLNLIVIVALISNYLVPVKFLSKRNIKLQLPDNTIQKRRTIGIVTKSLISCALIAGTTYYINCGIRLYKANTNWKIAFTTYQMGAYSACIENYENAFPYLQYDGDFLLNYGKALSMAEEHKKAVEVLEYTKNYYPNTVLQTALGDSYKALGQIKKSEEAYLQASWMIPSKFYPKYLLAKLYDETGQDEKATQVATELLSKKVKIESTAIKEIQQEMRAIITRNQNST